MLQIKNVSLTHRLDLNPLTEDLSFTLNRGDRAVLIGEEGNGKSTLLKWIYDPSLIEAYCDWKGERIVTGEKLAYLPQELPSSSRECPVTEYFFADTLTQETVDADYGQMARLAARFSLPEDIYYRTQPMQTLSGGERVKLQLVKLLLTDPSVLLLDEPSNDIDIDSLQVLEQLINSWAGIVLYISHDETLIERTANVVIHLEQLHRKKQCQATVARMDYRTYVEKRRSAFDRQQQMAESDLRDKRIRDEKFRRIMQKVEHDQAAVSRQDPHSGYLLRKKMHAVKSMGRRFEKEDQNMTEMPVSEMPIDFSFGQEAEPIPAGKTVIDFHLDTLYAPSGQDRVLARNISLFVRGSEKICFIGQNGVGKTTLLRKIKDELMQRPDLDVVYMPQNYAELLDGSQTPVEYLAPSGSKEEVTKVRTYLGALHYMTDEMDHPISGLSGGQKAKLFLLKLNLSKASVLVLDEPTRNFSPLSGPVIREMLRQFPGAILSISHDRKYIREVCDTVYRLTDRGLIRISKEEIQNG